MIGTNLQAALTSAVNAELVDANGLMLLGTCTGTPPTTASLFQHGCLLNQTDSGTGNTATWENQGSSAVPSWNLLGVVNPSEIVVSNNQSFKDNNGNNAFTFGVVASAVNSVKVTNSATGNAVKVSATGTDTNVGVSILGQGSGAVGLNNVAGSTGTVQISNGTDLGGMTVQGPSTLTSANTGAFVVGPNGTTNPSLKVDTSTASAVNGLKVTASATTADVDMVVIGDTAVSGLTIEGKAGGAATVLGGKVAVTGGLGNTSGAGGAVSMTGGQGGATGAGGVASLVGGAGGATSGNGAAVNVTGGAGTNGNGNGGDVIITGGALNGSGVGGKIFTRSTRLKLQGAPTAATTSATLTAAQILAGIITVNQGGGASSAQQLPLATDLDLALPTALANDAFDFSVINISAVAAEAASVTTNTGWTLVGDMDIQANSAATTKSAGQFRARKTAAGAWTLYRIS